MSKRWKITIEAWPYSMPNKTAAEAQKLCGGREHTFHVDARDFAEAFELAKAISMGIQANPACWEAPIKAIALTEPPAPPPCKLDEATDEPESLAAIINP